MRLIFIILLITCNLLAQTPPVTNTQLPVSVQSGLVGYWALNEASWNGTAGEVKDYTTNHLNGVRQGTAAITTTSKFGKAGVFPYNAGKSLILVADNDLLTLSSGMTFSCWFKKSALTAVAWGKDQTNGEFEFYLADGGGGAGLLRFYIFDKTLNGSIVRGIANINAYLNGAWHLLTGTWDGTTNVLGIKIYIDGVKKDDGSYSAGSFTAMRNSTDPFTIGGYNTSADYSFIEQMDDVALWNRPLSLNEITAIYRAGVGGMIIQ